MTELMKAMTKIASCMVAIFVIYSQSAFGGENDSTEIGRELIQAEPRIIGGNEPNPDRYSYAVSLVDEKGQFCGGSLIAKDVVLTAAHCTGDKYEIVIGRHNLNKPGGDVVRKRFERTHPKFDFDSPDNDFGLIFLSQPTTVVEDLVNLNSDPSLPRDGDRVTVMGWGDVDKSDDVEKFSNKLKNVEVKIVSNAECERSKGTVGIFDETFKNQITKNMLCAAGRNKDACVGDSGGPLVVRGGDRTGADDVQVGIVSWGVSCAHPDFPGVYSRISAGYSWIRSEVCRWSNYKPSTFNCSVNSPGVSDESSSSSNEESNKNDGKWETIATENFESGNGIFKSRDRLTRHRYSMKNRKGVLLLQKKSTASSERMRFRGPHSQVKVTFSFFARGMESNDEFCLDKKVRRKWKEVKCWNSREDFRNRRWYDGTTVTFSAGKQNGVAIRFRCEGNSVRDDVLIDKVLIEAS